MDLLPYRLLIGQVSAEGDKETIDYSEAIDQRAERDKLSGTDLGSE